MIGAYFYEVGLRQRIKNDRVQLIINVKHTIGKWDYL